ncbi:VOC family protein [Chloroflexota bacterium]
MIRGIAHSSFTISNLEDTIHFFCDLLGLEATPIREVKGEFIEKITQMPGASLRISMVNTPDNSIIEFIEYVSPKGDRIDLKTCNIGTAHVAFVVDDMQKMYDDLSAKGVQFNHPPLWVENDPARGRGICYLKGPDGITLEFIQLPKGT